MGNDRAEASAMTGLSENNRLMALGRHDRMVVLHAPDRRLAKLVAADGTVHDYDGAYRFNAASVPVAGLIPLLGLLTRLVAMPDRCVVRGELIGASRQKNIRRLALPDAETGDQPTLREVPRRWLALDCEGIERPAHIPADDLEACADHVTDRLPPVFQRSTHIVQASAKHGIRPDIRLRLWFWADRPIGGDELKRWLKGTCCDASVFRTNQPVYTAAPVFAPGRADHLPERLKLLEGEQWLRVPSACELAPPPPRDPVPVERIAAGDVGDAYARGALIGAANAIIGAGEGNRHETIVREASNLARLVQVGLVTSGNVSAVLTRAAQQAGKDDGKEIALAIGWGMKNPAAGALPEARRHG